MMNDWIELIIKYKALLMTNTPILVCVKMQFDGDGGRDCGGVGGSGIVSHGVPFVS